MSIVGGLDVHRRQITFDWVHHGTGETGHGRVKGTREVLRSWLGTLPAGEAAFAVEACTGWRFVVEELTAAGFAAHLAEPADTATLRGRKRRAKTDRADARHLRELLEQRRLPESWIPPGHILDLRELVRLRKTLGDQRVQWQQRIHAVLFHHGLPTPEQALTSQATRAWLERVDLPEPSRLLIATGLGEVDAVDARVAPLDRWLSVYARRQPGCRALIDELYGVGPVTAPTILAELGDARRFRNGDAVVRYTGLDVTVYSSDGKRTPGRLSRQGPEVLRWALFEAAKCSARASAPDHDYYQDVRERLTANRATLSVARKLVRRARHILAGLGDAALAPVDVALLPPLVPAVPAAADAA
jgi:transposase